MERPDEPRYRRYLPPSTTVPESAPASPHYELYGSVPPAASTMPHTAIPPSGSRSNQSRRLGPVLGMAATAVLLAAGLTLFAARTGGNVVVATPHGSMAVDSASIKGQLEASRARYVDALRSDRLPSVGLRDTAFNRVAVVAFNFFLTDMIVASDFGVDDRTAVGYARDAATYERLLLSEQPLGDDISIRFSAHREFRYNGSTGTGGYVDPNPG